MMKLQSKIYFHVVHILEKYFRYKAQCNKREFHVLGREDPLFLCQIGTRIVLKL